MLHIQQIKDDDYTPKYLDGSYVPGRIASQWIGGLQNQLKLSSQVDRNTISTLLKRDIDAEWSKSNNSTMRGIDLTFSAPKGVSIAALVTQDHRLLEAHEQAVAATMQYIETKLTYRITKDYQTDNKRTKGTIAAIFHRFASRSGDPLLHSHCILFNIAKREDNVFCALDNSLIFKAKLGYGQVYRSELARRIMSLGIEVAWDREYFDIDCIDHKTKKIFSTRKDQIDQELDRLGIKNQQTSTKRVTAIAAYTATREKDVFNKTLEDFLPLWIRKWPLAASFSMPLSVQLTQQIFDAGTHEIVKTSYQELAEKNRLPVARHDLVREIQTRNQGCVSIADVETAIELFIVENDLVEDGPIPRMYIKQAHKEYLEAINRGFEDRKQLRLIKSKELALKQKEKMEQSIPSTLHIRVRLSETEKQELSKIAKLRGTSISHLCRQALACTNEISSEIERNKKISEKRDCHIRFRISSCEKDNLIKSSKEMGASLSDVALSLIRALAIKML